jgi:hypothetical protein
VVDEENIINQTGLGRKQWLSDLRYHPDNCPKLMRKIRGKNKSNGAKQETRKEKSTDRRGPRHRSGYEI